MTATWSSWEEWHDDQFGQEFDLDECDIGKPPDPKLAASLSFWYGCVRVEWVDGPPRACEHAKDETAIGTNDDT